MAVESADQHTPGKTHRFVGICILRGGCGLRAHFTLRNIIDHLVSNFFFIIMFDQVLPF